MRVVIVIRERKLIGTARARAPIAGLLNLGSMIRSVATGYVTFRKINKFSTIFEIPKVVGKYKKPP